MRLTRYKGLVVLIELRNIDLGDSADILSWRNDELTRKMSRNQSVIAENEHSNWLKNAVADPKKIFFLGVSGGDKVGLVRCDCVDNAIWEMNILVSPLYRGMGIGASLLGLSISEIIGIKNPSMLIASVKKDNASSLKIFSSNNFSQFGIDGDLIQLSLLLRR